MERVYVPASELPRHKGHPLGASKVDETSGFLNVSWGCHLDKRFLFQFAFILKMSKNASKEPPASVVCGFSVAGKKPLKHCKVNFWHPGYCVRTAFLLNCKTQKKNSEWLKQNWHLHSNILSFTHASHVIQALNADTRFQILPPSNQKRQATSNVMSETKCWASVPLPTMVDPNRKTWFLCVLNLGRKHSVAQVLQNDRESLGAAFGQSLHYFWMSSLHAKPATAD